MLKQNSENLDKIFVLLLTSYYVVKNYFLMHLLDFSLSVFNIDSVIFVNLLLS